ncbi:type IV toxin-antitoxin system AbiEi family antitoxin domain-containing protein [Mariniluteicoccus flavus]
MQTRPLISTAQFLASGRTAADLTRMLRSGELFRLRRGVYAWSVDLDKVPSRDLTIDDRVKRHLQLLEATAPALAKESVISHVSAGLIHDLPVPLHQLDRVTTLRDGSGQGRLTANCHLRRSQLPDHHVIIRDDNDLALTSLERTVVDLARTLEFRDALAVVDVALAREVEREALIAHLLPRNPGNAQARRAIALGDARSESPGESRCRATMHLAALPMPDLQVSVVDHNGEEVARCDYGWEAYGLVGEFDGMVKYGRLLRPGQSVDDVIRAEKQREGRILQQGRWIARWITPDLRNIAQFRAGVLSSLAAARGRRTP